MSESLLFSTATLLKKKPRHRCFLENFSIFSKKHFFKKHLRWLLLQRLSTKKYFTMKGLCNYPFHVLLSRTRANSCMWGFQKEKIGKKSCKINKGCQKNLRFLFKICFTDKPFLVYKKIIYFSESIFPGVTSNIFEEYIG